MNTGLGTCHPANPAAAEEENSVKPDPLHTLILLGMLIPGNEKGGLAGSREERLKRERSHFWRSCAGSLTVALAPVRPQLEAGAAGTAEGARGVHTAMGTPAPALCTLINICKNRGSRSDGCRNKKITLLLRGHGCISKYRLEGLSWVAVCKGQHPVNPGTLYSHYSPEQPFSLSTIDLELPSVNIYCIKHYISSISQSNLFIIPVKRAMAKDLV